jgi:hypothetical protein
MNPETLEALKQSIAKYEKTMQPALVTADNMFEETSFCELCQTCGKPLTLHSRKDWIDSKWYCATPQCSPRFGTIPDKSVTAPKEKEKNE